jgi:hypothetical protein
MNAYGRTKVFPASCQTWQKLMKSNNLPASLTSSSFSKAKHSYYSNAELGRLPQCSHSRQTPHVRDGILFTPELLHPETAPEIFEGNAKFQWVDDEAGWCHLCQEAVSNAFIHIGEREHQCMSIFVLSESSLLFTKRQAVDRFTSSACSMCKTGIPLEGQDPISKLAHHVRKDPMTIEPSHLFTLDDEQRYSELEALITFAAMRDLDEISPNLNIVSEVADLVCDEEGNENHRFSKTLLSHILQMKTQIPLHSQGEKLFKVILSRMIVEMFPPLSPVSHTQLSHKCWGRTNEEMLYCRLNLGKLQEKVGGQALTTKDQRAYMIRNLFWELIVATEFRCDEDFFDPVAVTIGKEILRRLSFELIYSMSMHFMNRAQTVVEMMDFPEVEELARYNSL